MGWQQSPHCRALPLTSAVLLLLAVVSWGGMEAMAQDADYNSTDKVITCDRKIRANCASRMVGTDLAL